MRKILPILLVLVGLGGGVAGGLVLRPSPDEEGHDSIPDGEAATAAKPDAHDKDAEHPSTEFVKMNNQFVVPVVQGGRVTAMVVLALTMEVSAGSTDQVFAREPKLRDALLQVMFDHANVGGFNGSFTDGSNLIVLRGSLKEAALAVIGPIVSNVLITDIARQDG